MALHELYQQTIKQHHHTPCGENPCFIASHRASGDNPNCGDELEIMLTLDDQQQIEQIGFHADACMICRASASMLCAWAPNQSIQSIQSHYLALKHAFKSPQTNSFGPFASLSAVAKHKTRIQCALLPWSTLLEALSVETEGAV